MDLLGEGVPETLTQALPGRPVRFYRGITSTDMDAIAWVRSGAPEGSVVVAETSINARGHGERLWEFLPGRSLAFTVILRPMIPPIRQGWIHMVGLSGIADIIGADAAVEWPASVLVGDSLAGGVGVKVAPDPGRIVWAVLNVFVREPSEPRVGLLVRLLDAIEARYRADPESTRADYLARCRTVGRRVSARLIPVGPAGRRITGPAVDVRADGALMIEIEEGRPVPVRAQSVGILEDAPEDDAADGSPTPPAAAR